jgi:hypothetical protein
MRAPARLIVATCVAIVVVMTVMLAPVVVCVQFWMCLIAWIGGTLFIRLLGVLVMDATGLEVLVFALGGTLPVVAFVVIATAVVAELALLASAMLRTMVAAITLIVQPVTPMLVREKGFLMRILFLQLAV